MTLEEHRLKGKRKGALLKEQIWYEDGQAVAYSLAYINLKLCTVDNGRVFERFHNSRAFSCIVQGGIFLRKMPLEVRGFKVQQLWNRYRLRQQPRLSPPAFHGACGGR